MKTSDFDYHLPEELIAQRPLANRTDSRLLLVDRESLDLQHDTFGNLGKYLVPGDVLVMNDTKVMPARLIGVKKNTGAEIEVLLLNQVEGDVWETITRPARRVKEGTIISFGDGSLVAKCVKVLPEGIRHFEMLYQGVFLEILDRLGEMPLPPYIHVKLEDRDRYQTVYSKVVGSAAAPTAGLHFTNELLLELKSNGVEIVYLTLHVGLGTFRPVAVEDVEKHRLHEEYYALSAEAAERLRLARFEKRRIIAVGTTSTRTLETIHGHHGDFVAASGYSDIFIYPGFNFKAIDGLITNFHLPKSTLLMLVSAFSSKAIIMNAYNEAVKEKYRFFSFGDSMFIRKK
ncbi:MAG: tRNA preQ1(34) S-adenosylmethionine ribosyltransferase-isomerase QueA [Bacilli bacterium]|nr:tRNA preQ1(34) S-adenosylmethionine ribosyltransferase-isomerase QueA [Bacilli bacterium]MBN2696943.1 tRNA preQ1(34) S-adenosylmethionine ribosyltransferase-isomerase QueA [Bacilli bacterium]